MIGYGAFLMGFGMFMLNFSFVFYLAIIACVIYTMGEMSFFSVAQLVCYQEGGAQKKVRVWVYFKPSMQQVSWLDQH